jgi:hypothetical protein
MRSITALRKHRQVNNPTAWSSFSLSSTGPPFAARNPAAGNGIFACRDRRPKIVLSESY